MPNFKYFLFSLRGKKTPKLRTRYLEIVKKHEAFEGCQGLAPEYGPGFGVLYSNSIDDLAVVALECRLERNVAHVTTTTREDAARL